MCPKGERSGDGTVGSAMGEPGIELHLVSAGGVPYRIGAEGIEVLLVEDRYGKWTFPKGRQEPGETLEATALREIREETGLLGEVEGSLGDTVYRYFERDGRHTEKRVEYYLVHVNGGRATPQLSEIAEVRRLAPADSDTLLKSRGYANNHRVWNRALELLRA